MQTFLGDKNMQTEKKSKPAQKTKNKKKAILLLLALLLALILLLALVIPAFVSSEKGRQTILAKINDSLDGKTDFETLSMSWFKGLKVTELRFDDNTGKTSVQVKQITAKPHYISLLTGALSFGKTVIDQPKVRINLQPPQPSKPADTQIVTDTQTVTDKKTDAVVLPIKKIDLVVKDGDLKVTGAGADTVQLSRINSKVNLRPPGQKTNFNIDMTLNDADKQSTIRAAGQLTPKRRTGWSLKGTSGNLTVEVNDLDIASLAPLFSLTGLDIRAKGNLSADLKSKIKDGWLENLSGTVKAANLDIAGPALKGDRFKTEHLDLAVQLYTEKDLINIEKLNIKSDWANVRATGTVPKTTRSLAQFFKPDAKHDLKANFDCDVAALSSQMGHALGLREGTKITSGRLTGSIETSTANGKRKIAAAANLDNLKGSFAEKSISLSQPITAQTQITSDKTGINFDTLRVSAAFANLNCTGTAESLNYNANINLEKLQAELGPFLDLGPYQMAGNLTGDGQASIGKKKIAVAGSSVCKNLRLTSKENMTAFEPQADVEFSLNVETDENIVNLDFINAKTSFGQVKLKDSVLPIGEKTKKSAKFDVAANVDLAGLQPFAVLLAGLPKEMKLAGSADSRLLVTSKNDAYKIFTDSTQIKNLKIVSPGQEPFYQDQVSLVFDGDYNPTEKNLLVRKFYLISPDIKIKGDFQQDTEAGQTKIQGKADLEYDWSAVSTVASAFLPQGLKLSGKRKDSISFTTSYPSGQTQKLMSNLTTKGKLGFDTAEYMGLVFGPTEVDINVQKGLLNIAPFSTSVNKGRLNFAAAADFNQKPSLLRIPRAMQIASGIQINDVTSRLLLKYVNPIFANAVSVSGIANFDCETLAIPLAGATKNDLEIVGTIAIDQLQLRTSDLLGQILTISGIRTAGQNIKLHPTRFVLHDGFLTYDNMQMDFGNSPINFRGTIGLDKTLDMIVTLPYTTRGRVVRIGEPIDGARITLPLGGTTDKPELSTSRLLEEQLRQQLEEQLRRGLERILR